MGAAESDENRRHAELYPDEQDPAHELLGGGRERERAVERRILPAGKRSMRDDERGDGEGGAARGDVRSLDEPASEPRHQRDLGGGEKSRRSGEGGCLVERDRGVGLEHGEPGRLGENEERHKADGDSAAVGSDYGGDRKDDEKDDAVGDEKRKPGKLVLRSGGEEAGGEKDNGSLSAGEPRNHIEGKPPLERNAGSGDNAGEQKETGNGERSDNSRDVERAPRPRRKRRQEQESVRRAEGEQQLAPVGETRLRSGAGYAARLRVEAGGMAGIGFVFCGVGRRFGGHRGRLLVVVPPGPAPGPTVTVGGGSGLAGGVDGYGAPAALAVALGANAANIGQGYVHDAPVGGRHRFEIDARAIADGALRHSLSELPQLTFAPLAVLLDIDNDAAGASLALVEDEVGDELERSERFAAPSDEEARVFALDVYDRVLLGVGGANRGLSVDIQFVEDARDDVERVADIPAVAREEADADSGGFGADAENAGASRTKNVDLDFVAADAELEGGELDRFLYGLGCPGQALVCRVFHCQAPCPAGLS